MPRPTITWLKNQGPILALLLGLVALIYSQTLSFAFINFDDPVYVTDNVAVKGGLTVKGLAWAFDIHSDICMYYQPLAFVSHMLDCHLFGLNPGLHHLSSVVIHAANAVLLFLILQAMTGSRWRSALAAVIFAVHPVNVDAVAWISERKTVLCALFWLLGMAAYLAQVRKPATLRYAAVMVCMALGLLTKPVMITFPCALILLDIWPLGRTGIPVSWRGLRESIRGKIPLFVLTALWFVTPFLSDTLMAHETTPAMVPYGLRLANAVVAYAKYVTHFIWPRDLSILYPYPDGIPMLQALAALAFLAAVTAACAFRFRSSPGRLIGWLWFCGTMFPTSGLILGTLWPERADRWAYIPYIGLAVALAFSLPGLSRLRSRWALVLVSMVVLYLGALAWMARAHTAHFQDSIHIFEKALSVIDYHALPHQNLAAAWMEKKDYHRAMHHLSIILDHEPDHGPASYNMGLCLAETGRPEEALSYFETALTLDPSDTRTRLMAARMLTRLERPDEALTLYEKGLTRSEKNADLLYDLAMLLLKQGRNVEAEQRLITLVSTWPGHGDGHAAYASLMIDRKNHEKALIHAKKLAALEPDSARTHSLLGVCYARLGHYDDAVLHFEDALRLQPGDRETRLNLETARTDKTARDRCLDRLQVLLPDDPVLTRPEDIEQRLSAPETTLDQPGRIQAMACLATLYRLRGNYDKALGVLDSALGLDDDYAARIRYNMACLNALMNRPDEAAYHLEKALADDPRLWPQIDQDPDFDGIRRSAAFLSLEAPKTLNPPSESPTPPGP
jgi:tetratricopeptide (TPR) repeat protein